MHAKGLAWIYRMFGKDVPQHAATLGLSVGAAARLLPLASHETDRLYFARFPERVRGPFRELMTNIHMVLLMFLR